MGDEKQIFKPWEPQQEMILAPSLEELNPDGHLVMAVSKMYRRQQYLSENDHFLTSIPDFWDNHDGGGRHYSVGKVSGE